MKIAKDDDRLEVSIPDEVAVFIEDGELCAKLSSGKIVSSDNLPKWVMFRSDDWQLAYALEEIGCSVFPSSEFIRMSADKALSHIALRDVFKNYDALLMVGNTNVWELEPPYMLKGTTGHGGYAVQRVERAWRAIDGIKDMLSQGIQPMLQQLAPSPDDLRVYVVGNEILYAVLRKAAEGSDVANFCNGGSGTIYKLSDSERNMIKGAIETLSGNLGFISFDFFIADDGSLIFNETNAFPGLKGLVEQECEKGFVREYMQWLDASVTGKTCSAEDTFSSVSVMRSLEGR